MKIYVNKIKPNPYRNLNKYPIDRLKVESLKVSIQETEFWDNILARSYDDHFQLAYGHHRLLALNELGVEEIDIPVKDIDNPTMLKIMANENMDSWESNPSVIVETVRATRDYLNAELSKYDSWEALPPSLIDLLGSNKHTYSDIKSKGVGQTTILKFLGSNWKQWKIQEALSVLNDENLNVEIVEEFDNYSDFISFKKAIKKTNVPIEDQKELARKVASVRKETPIKRTQDHAKIIQNITRQESEGLSQFQIEVENATYQISEINKDAKNLADKIDALHTRLTELQIQKVDNLISSTSTSNSFTTLFHAIKRYMKFYGLQLNEKYDE